jgi:hypothetical protein
MSSETTRARLIQRSRPTRSKPRTDDDVAVAHRSFPRRPPVRAKPPVRRGSGARGQYAVGLIAAGAAILGALAGGWVTYLGNRSLDQERSQATARGTARVLQADLMSIDVRLSAMVQARRMFAPDPGLPISLSLDDRKLIATNLTAGEWASVATALAVIRREGAVDVDEKHRAIAGFRVDLDAADLGYYRDTDRIVRDGIRALEDLTGTRY